MSLNDEIKILTDNEIENILIDIDIAKKKGKDISYISFLFPWISLTIWKLLVYTQILPGTFWKPIRKLLPSLSFYGCFTSKGCEQFEGKTK